MYDFDSKKINYRADIDHLNRQRIASEIWFQLEDEDASKSLRVIDPTDVLCDDQHCLLMDQGNSLYTDYDHLSGCGVSLLNPLIKAAMSPK